MKILATSAGTVSHSGTFFSLWQISKSVAVLIQFILKIALIAFLFSALKNPWMSSETIGYCECDYLTCVQTTCNKKGAHFWVIDRFMVVFAYKSKQQEIVKVESWSFFCEIWKKINEKSCVRITWVHCKLNQTKTKAKENCWV